MKARCGEGRGRHRGRWPHRYQRLSARLFGWFLGAIVLAVASSALTVHLTRSEAANEGPVRVVSRSIAGHLARDWDDPRATDAYAARLRDQLGLDLRVERAPEALPPHVRRAGRRDGSHDTPRDQSRNASVVFGHDGHAYIPIVRGGEVVGAAVFDVPAPAPQLERVAAALGVALIVLVLAAVRVSRQLARPLEQVASAAERFGDGDLSARTDIGRGPRRWVASEVAEVAGAFDRMASRIETVVRDQRELLAAISHELRSPLGRARVALEIARDREGEPLPARLLDDVERPLGEVDAILGDLLAAARAGLSDLRADKTALLPWLRARIAAEPAPPVVELIAPDEADGLELAIDGPLLGRAVHNLLANARVHGHPAELPLEVHLELDNPERVRIAVRDHGGGFSPDLLPRVFEPFVRGDTARSPGTGTGLGLALVRRIAEAHGGTAFARNIENGDGGGSARGAEVGVELPRRRT